MGNSISLHSELDVMIYKKRVCVVNPISKGVIVSEINPVEVSFPNKVYKLLNYNIVISRNFFSETHEESEEKLQIALHCTSYIVFRIFQPTI